MREHKFTPSFHMGGASDPSLLVAPPLPLLEKICPTLKAESAPQSILDYSS